VKKLSRATYVGLMWGIITIMAGITITACVSNQGSERERGVRNILNRQRAPEMFKPIKMSSATYPSWVIYQDTLTGVKYIIDGAGRGQTMTRYWDD
jgi:hypothetical protein